MKTTIVWFRNDLRVHDHPALAQAAQDGDIVIPLFIFSNGLLRGKHSSSNRNRFLLESLEDLRGSLQKLGSDLLVRTGKPYEVLLQVAQEAKATDVFYSIDYTPYARSRDRAITEALEQANLQVTAFPGRLAIDSLQGIQAANGNIYKVFTPFWKNWSKVERRLVAEVPQRLPDLPEIANDGLPALDALIKSKDLSPDVIPGGETAGRQRLHDFMDNGIAHYTEMHDSLTPDGTSRLSAYLHFGCVSVREIETMIPDGDSAARFHRQLAWRDFYNYVLFHYPQNATEEFQERFRTMDWSYDDKLLQAWQTAQTGYPIVDAAMQQLLREGWMHNRARLIVGSFVTKDLGLDWRLGEEFFMRMLVDGDEANNNGNWQWIASVGVDPAPVFRRLYNPMTQQKRYDADGSYVRYYVPVLSKVPDKYLAEPWTMPLEVQQQAGCIIGTDYPAPVVDHAVARLATLDKFRGQTIEPHLSQ